MGKEGKGICWYSKAYGGLWKASSQVDDGGVCGRGKETQGKVRSSPAVAMAT